MYRGPQTRGVSWVGCRRLLRGAVADVDVCAYVWASIHTFSPSSVVYLADVHLFTGMHLIVVHLIVMHLTGVHLLQTCISYRRMSLTRIYPAGVRAICMHLKPFNLGVLGYILSY